MSKAKVDYSLRDKQGKRLTKELIDKYGMFRNGAKLKPFMEALESYEEISVASLSRICKGQDPIDSHAVAFGEVLDVLPDYLLCRCDYRTEDERKQAIISEYEAQRNKQFNDTIQSSLHNLNNRIAIIRRTIKVLEDRGYAIRYSIDDPYYLINASDEYVIYRNTTATAGTSENKYADYSSDPICRIAPEDIYNQFCSSSLARAGITINDKKHVHIISIDIVAPDYFTITLSPDSFARMLYDIDDEISHRIKSWMHYQNYSISECDDSDCRTFWENT